MNREQFIEEVLESDICPINFQKNYKKFNEYQKLSDDALLEFHRVCEKNQLHYQLAYGSLLGAIRDGGQIPWDYDVDVFVPFEEKETLIEALEKDLNKRYYFYCPEVNKKCRHVIMRIAPIGYRSEALHVDVFFLTGSPDDELERKQFVAEIKEISLYRYDKLVKIFDERFSVRSSIKKILRKIRCIPYNPDKAYLKYNRLCCLYPAMESHKCISADGFADWYEFDGDKIWNTKLLKTEIGELRVPENYQYILKLIYGDFEKILPLENRLKEMMLHYRQLERFAKE